MPDKAVCAADKSHDRFVEDLKNLVRIPSVSFPGFDLKQVRRSAEAVARLLKTRGLENVRIVDMGGAHPYVLGDWLHASGAPTVLLYAHHDVQPPGRREAWKSPPFEPTVRKGRMYARGAADDKAGVVVHASSICSWLQAHKRLPLNVKVVIEGEEEVGSGHLEAFLKKHRKRLQSDVMVLADTGNYDVGLPSFTTSLRGIVVADVEVRTADHPLHSGMWGGPLPDPVQALAKMIASLSDKRGRLAIPGAYRDVRPLTSAERREFAALHYSEKAFRKHVELLPGVRTVGGSSSLLAKLWREPSISVNAIQASSRKDAANIVNASAWCRIGIRIVPDQKPRDVLRRLKAHLKRNAPWGVRVAITGEAAAPWWQTPTDHPAFTAAREAMRKGFGRKATAVGCGGSIPFAGPFSRALGGIPALLVGVEDPYSNPHSENESLHLGDFKKAIRSSIHLYQELANRLN